MVLARWGAAPEARMTAEMSHDTISAADAPKSVYVGPGSAT